MRCCFRTAAILLCLCLVVGCFSGCDILFAVLESGSLTYNEPDIAVEQPAPKDGASWTVLLYLCGTDLESNAAAATHNLSELMDVTMNDNVNYIIQTGGTRYWQNDVISSRKLQRWETVSGGLRLVDEGSLESMGAADTLGGFLKWGVETYPADKYMAAIWNHGGGATYGLAFDEMYNNDSLDLNELAEGFSMAGVTFDVIGFDTCLMATLETAAAVAPYGKVMVASEEYEPGGGWDYTAYPQYICQNPKADALDVGIAICDSYYEKCEASGNGAMATLSVIDLDAVDELVDAFDAMAAEMTGVTESIGSYRALVQGVKRSENYGGNTREEGYTNMVDLGDLAMNTKDVLSNTADDVLNALFDAVLYNVNGASRSEANGLSVFFPLGYSDETLNAFATISPSSQYVRFVEAATGWEAPPVLVENTQPAQSVVGSQEDYAVTLSSYVDDEAYFTLVIESGLEAVSSVQFALYYMDYDYDEYMLMGYDNDLEGDWETGIFKDNFRGVWAALNGYYCAPTLIGTGDDYNVYSIPIMLNGEQTNLRASYIFEADGDGHYEIHGAWDGLDGDTGMSSKEITKLEDGDEIAILFEAANWDTGETNTYETGSFIVDGQVELEEIALFDGDYMYEYLVIDVFGNEYYSDPAIMECDDGDIYVYETE